MDAFDSDFIFDLGPLDGVPADSGVLDRNLRALARTCPATANRIASSPASPDLEWVDSEEGQPGLVLIEPPDFADPFGLSAQSGPTKRVLASRRRPVTEAKRLAESVDILEHGGVCVMGFGAGYHCAEFAERMGEMGAIVCFEPDVPLLRAVFERIDHSAWIEKTNFVLLTDPDDGTAIGAGIGGIEGILALGVKIVEHPASRPRLGDQSTRFGERFANAMKSLRTTIMTTLVRAQASLRNMVMNADYYASTGGLEPLAGAGHGRPAIVVSAGPSLERNIDLLKAPEVREHAVIIAVQTMLKPLLRRGIKPHFVCALDYHELSRRFYEGLSAEDVEGVTLVVEPKANPAILDAFPGRIVCVQEEMLDRLLGPELAGQKWPLKAGATVAHLCAYLGRHLGCDPLILVGQDLGFTDGQYYAAGAAIHDVWAGELGPMRTLEMFEWERIVRSKSLLRKATDIQGRPIYTDEQMATYLSQFEIDFAADARAGLRVIDATEGGVRKAHTEVMSLARALELHANGDRLALDEILEKSPGGRERASVVPLVAARLGQIADQADEVEACSRKASSILAKMAEPGVTAKRVDRLIGEVYKVRDEVRVYEPAYGLVQFINQAGALRRFRADRTIDLDRELKDRERQVKQIERDISNVEWTADAAGELAALLRESAAAIRGERARQTDEPTPRDVEVGASPTRVAALLMYDEKLNGLGLARSESVAGEPAIARTVRRLLAAREPDEIIIATGAVDVVRGLLGELASDKRVAIEPVDGEALRRRVRAVGRARLLSPDAWRGALGGLSCYDESFEPALAAGVLRRRGIDAAVIVGADWALVDPTLIDAVVLRHREQPETVRLSLTQAAPGLAGLLLDTESIERLGEAMGHAANFATVGGLLSYLPVAPQADPIAKAFCVPLPHAVRDAGRRFIPDTLEGEALIEGVLEALGDRWISADAGTIVAASPAPTPEAPRHLELELCTGRLTSGLFGQWLRGAGGAERPVLAVDAASRIIESFASGRPDTVLTLHGVGDPLMHPGVFDIVAAARAAGVGLVHLRTDGLSDAFDPDRLASSGLDVVSVDLLAASELTYTIMAGVDRYETVKTRVEALLGVRGTVAGLPGLWAVPRITRCDEVYEEIESFYNGWLMAACSAVIDPIPDGAALSPSARIRALPLPALARARRSRETLIVRSDGSAFAADGAEAGDVLADGLENVWRGEVRVAA
ncbi:MAG: DUF115 domain-containing protein [Phycisphaeraceae bacterium]|nr:MAG: DUF115 domain-containing protein [Phycisphaeraceae bacterium]